MFIIKALYESIACGINVWSDSFRWTTLFFHVKSIKKKIHAPRVIKSLSMQLLILFPFFSAVDCFKEEYVSENVVKKLIRQNVVEEVVKKETDEQFLFRENVPCDYFILILQGRCAINRKICRVMVLNTKWSVKQYF